MKLLKIKVYNTIQRIYFPLGIHLTQTNCSGCNWSASTYQPIFYCHCASPTYLAWAYLHCGNFAGGVTGPPPIEIIFEIYWALIQTKFRVILHQVDTPHCQAPYYYTMLNTTHSTKREISTSIFMLKVNVISFIMYVVVVISLATLAQRLTLLH